MIVLFAVLAVLSGTVHGWHDNRPVAHAQVTVQIGGSAVASTTTGRDGRFVLAGVPPGAALLTVVAPGYAPVSVRMCVHENEVRRLPLRMAAGGSIPYLTAVSKYDASVANGLNPDTAADVYNIGC